MSDAKPGVRAPSPSLQSCRTQGGYWSFWFSRNGPSTPGLVHHNLPSKSAMTDRYRRRLYAIQAITAGAFVNGSDSISVLGTVNKISFKTDKEK